MNTTDFQTDATELWNRAKAIYLLSLNSTEEKSQAERYLGMITRVSNEGSYFTIWTNGDFAANLIQEKYASKLRGSFLLAGATETLDLSVQEDKNISLEPLHPVIPSAPQKSSAGEPQNSPHVTHFVSTQPLNDDYTFEEFVRGPSNSFALSAAQAVVSNPGKHGFYNPLFIHGDTGLGKTHLMQAIGNELKKTRPEMAICYLTAETFLNEYINSLQNGQINSFRYKYRNVDLLLVDDVQFLQRGKDNFQEEFFNTFNFLMQNQKQIVMTSDVAPRKLPSIQTRLISRFEGGMVQEIESPSYETRIAILNKKAEGMNIELSKEVIEFIADNIKSHVRALEGSLMKVALVKRADPKTILDAPMLSYILKDIIKKEQSLKKLTIEEIQQACAKKYGVSLKDIMSHERVQSLVTPRQLAMYIARKYTAKGLKEIADSFQKKHATILNGVKTITERLTNEPALKDDLESILSTFGYQISDAMD